MVYIISNFLVLLFVEKFMKIRTQKQISHHTNYIIAIKWKDN